MNCVNQANDKNTDLYLSNLDAKVFCASVFEIETLNNNVFDSFYVKEKVRMYPVVTVQTSTTVFQ